MGPPGIGKTTLAATYAEARAGQCLWLQLDAGDGDCATFTHFLHAAAIALTPRPRLRAVSPNEDDLRDPVAFIRRSLRRLAAALELPWILVLDNVQELGSAPQIHAGIAAALAELPERARVIALSREPTPAEYTRALAAQQLVTVDERLLRFNDDDASRLVDLHGRDWNASDLRRATDGWAAAMILLLVARSDLGPRDALRSDATRDRLFDLFAGEVIDRMNEKSAHALMRISFLPSATSAMAKAISNDAQAGELLADLTRRSLFTECREGVNPIYTFHALFGEFLRARAQARFDPPILQSLGLAAADLLAANGQRDAAIAQLIEVQSWGLALEHIVAHADACVGQGRTESVRNWILALPQ